MDDVLDVLRSIDASLKTLVSIAQRRKAAEPEIATDRDLDGKYGDPKVHLNPRDWNGPSFKGRTMSECPAAFLELLAETLDYFASKAEASNEEYRGKPVAPYKRKDAARARGWAKRKRDRGEVSPAQSSVDYGTGDESPEWADDPEWNG